MVKYTKLIRYITMNTKIKYGEYIRHENGIDYYNETFFKPGFHVQRVDGSTGEYDKTVIIFKTESEAQKFAENTFFAYKITNVA